METGEQLKTTGMQAAIVSADKASEGWSDRAYEDLLKYARQHRYLMAEDVRQASESGIPPSKRAWGPIISRGKREGVISHLGHRSVKNPKAHKANASWWKSEIFEG